MHGPLVFPLKPVNDDEDNQLNVEQIRKVQCLPERRLCETLVARVRILFP